MSEKIRIALKAPEAPTKIPSPGSHLSTGSMLLNLALSDRPDGGFLPGHYYWIVGNSSSGKTFFSMTCFAEACKNSRYAKYRLVYDNVENGMLMNVRRLFGKSAEKRIEPPRGTQNKPKFSRTIEDFYFNLDRALGEGKPFIYVLDSENSLTSEQERGTFEERRKAHEKGKEGPGSYGDGKAKKHSEMLRAVMGRLEESESILIIVSQTRDNIGAGMFESKQTTSGGRSLKFYATCEIWTTPAGKIKMSVRGKERKIGMKVKVSAKKNRITGKEHDVETAIYPSYGIDDTGTCIDWLTEEKWWKKSGAEITVGDNRWDRTKLIQWLEDGNMPTLTSALQECWDAIEEAKRLKRKARYD